MELRELKKEVQQLPSIPEAVQSFHQHWVRPLRTTTPAHLPFLKSLDFDTRKELNQRLSRAHKLMGELESSQLLHERFHQYARYLIELKLTTLNADTRKAKQITQHLVNDDMLAMSTTIADTKLFDEKVKVLEQEYHTINTLLDKKLSLEEMLYYLDLPHNIYLQNLLKLSQKHTIIMRDLARHFISLTKQAHKP